jgi:hypothetical protein
MLTGTEKCSHIYMVTTASIVWLDKYEAGPHMDEESFSLETCTRPLPFMFCVHRPVVRPLWSPDLTPANCLWSLDLTPANFYLWGHLKSIICVQWWNMQVDPRNDEETAITIGTIPGVFHWTRNSGHNETQLSTHYNGGLFQTFLVKHNWPDGILFTHNKLFIMTVICLLVFPSASCCHILLMKQLQLQQYIYITISACLWM